MTWSNAEFSNPEISSSNEQEELPASELTINTLYGLITEAVEKGQTAVTSKQIVMAREFEDDGIKIKLRTYGVADNTTGQHLAVLGIVERAENSDNDLRVFTDYHFTKGKDDRLILTKLQALATLEDRRDNDKVEALSKAFDNEQELGLSSASEDEAERLIKN